MAVADPMVVVDDLQDRAAANRCLLGSGWRKDADLGPAGLAFSAVSAYFWSRVLRCEEKIVWLRES